MFERDFKVLMATKPWERTGSDMAGSLIPEGFDQLGNVLAKSVDAKGGRFADVEFDVQIRELWRKVWSALLAKRLVCYAIVPAQGLIAIDPGIWGNVRENTGPPGVLQWTDPSGGIKASPLVRNEDAPRIAALWAEIRGAKAEAAAKQDVASAAPNSSSAERLGREAVKIPEHWTVDQALLWIGTGDLKVVDGAAPWVPERSRRTWISHLLDVSDGAAPPLRLPVREVEQKLLAMLMKGDVTAFDAQMRSPQHSEWFYKARLEQAGSRNGRLLNVPELSMCFRRLSDELFQSADLRFSSRPDLAMAPLIGTAPFVSARNEQPPSATASVVALYNPSEAQVATENSIKRGAKERYEWADLEEEAIRKLEEEGAIAPTLGATFNETALVFHLREWCKEVARWDKVPGRSTVAARVAKIVTKWRSSNSKKSSNSSK